MSAIVEKAVAKAGGVRALARLINVTPAAISQIRGDGIRPVSPEIAANCADYVGEDPVIAALEALRAHPLGRRSAP